jgi:hypothetical protein
MAPMIGVMVSKDILMAYQCQADLKPEPKLTLFTAMTPYLLLPDSFMTHLWHQ